MGALACILDGIKVLRFDGLIEVEDGPYGDTGVTHDNPMSFVNELSLRQTVDVEDRINSAIDLDDWLSDQTAQDRSMLMSRLEGCTGHEIGTRTGQSTSRCYHRLRELGHQLAEDSGLTHVIQGTKGAA